MSGKLEGTRVAVVGGGVAGLATAAALAERGAAVTVYERSSTLRATGGALVLWSNAIRALRRLGAAEATLRAGATIERGEIRTAAGELLWDLPLGALGRELGAPTIAIHRAALIEALATRCRAHDVSIVTGAALAQLRERERAVELQLAASTGEATTYDLLVGADGLRSLAREHILGVDAPRSAEQTAWLAVTELEHPALRLGATVGYVGAGSRFWIATLSPGSTYWYAVLPHGGVHANDHDSLLRAYEGWSEPIPALLRATPADALHRVQLCDRLPTSRWTTRRVALVGDAAQPMTPDLGQGACQALESAVVLASALDEHGREAGLRAYERQRMPRAAAIASLSWTVARANQSCGPAASWIREQSLRMIPKQMPMTTLRWMLDVAL